MHCGDETMTGSRRALVGDHDRSIALTIVSAALSDHPSKPDCDTVTYTLSAELPPEWYALLAREFHEIGSRSVLRIPELRSRHGRACCIDLFVRRATAPGEFERINDRLEMAIQQANARYNAEILRAGDPSPRALGQQREKSRKLALREQLRKRFPEH